jgi:hypothetical protein
MTMQTEPEEEPEVEDPAKLNTKPIPVPLDDSGFPALPPTTQNDNNKTKIVQSMLREYCTAHARELRLNVFSERFLTRMSKASSLERRARLFHGVHWLWSHRLGLRKTVPQMALSGRTLRRSGLERSIAC